MSQLNDFLNTEGICSLPDLYTASEIGAINKLVEPILSSRKSERRAYVHPDEMLKVGVFDQLLSARLKNVLFSIMPDPVIYHCHVYEIAANDTRSHIFGDSLMGWHRDPDSAYTKDDSTHVSLFVYLSDVGAEDGAFEFVPGVPPTKWLRSGEFYASVCGLAGYSFAWHRSYYHRAAPNRGSIRRRLFKISVQRNAFRSGHLGNAHFQKLLEQIPSGEIQLDLLLGRYQGRQAPKVPGPLEPLVNAVPAKRRLTLSSLDLAKAQLRERASQLKRKLHGDTEPLTAAYE